jgi:hypothetical protein
MRELNKRLKISNKMMKPPHKPRGSELNRPPLAQSQKVISPFNAAKQQQYAPSSSLDKLGMASPIQVSKNRSLNQTTSVTKLGLDFRNKGTMDSTL